MANTNPGLQLGPKGTKLIQGFEACAKKRPDGRFEAYPDPGSGGAPWTIGWGATGRGVKRGLVWTQQQCDERFAQDVEKFVAEVNAAIAGAPTTQNQFDALVSFHFNTGAIGKATLTELHRAGNYGAVAGDGHDITPGEFGKWVWASGRRMTGLIRRRAAEAALYRS